MSKADITCSMEATECMDDRRIHQIESMSYCYDVTSRQELLVLIKVLLDDLEKKDPSLRAATAKVRATCRPMAY